MAPQDTAETPLWSFIHLILMLEEELLDGSPVVLDVRLAIQLGVCEFASVIFVSSIFGSSQCSARATRAESP
jgi:hypothetical protein